MRPSYQTADRLGKAVGRILELGTKVFLLVVIYHFSLKYW
jgi:hypothetical protein